MRTFNPQKMLLQCFYLHANIYCSELWTSRVFVKSSAKVELCISVTSFEATKLTPHHHHKVESHFTIIFGSPFACTTNCALLQKLGDFTGQRAGIFAWTSPFHFSYFVCFIFCSTESVKRVPLNRYGDVVANWNANLHPTCLLNCRIPTRAPETRSNLNVWKIFLSLSSWH